MDLPEACWLLLDLRQLPTAKLYVRLTTGHVLYREVPLGIPVIVPDGMGTRVRALQNRLSTVHTRLR